MHEFEFFLRNGRIGAEYDRRMVGIFFRYLKTILWDIPPNMTTSMPDAMNFTRFADFVAALPRKNFSMTEPCAVSRVPFSIVKLL